MPVGYEETGKIYLFRIWFLNNGGKIHEGLSFCPDSSGLTVRTRNPFQSGFLAAACPFSLAITVEATQGALQEYCRLSLDEQANLSPRQLICAYIGLHYIIREVEDEKCLLRHRPYLSILPKAESLLTPLYFSDDELNIFRGTNMYGAALDLRQTYSEEYRQLLDAISMRSPKILDEFTFEIYLMAATYLSSRAFPSTLLSSNPSLTVTPSSYPVLLPGIDMFNHKRGQPVSWTILSTGSAECDQNNSKQEQSDLSVGLVIDAQAGEGEEIFNNYGPKPNSSLILAYGFALPSNPDDTIMLKIGSTADGTRSRGDTGHEVGQNSSGAESIWDDVRRIIASQYIGYAHSDISEEEGVAKELQIDMETAGTLSGMVSSLIERLPDLDAEQPLPSVRQEVRKMWGLYVRGQKDILEALLEWLDGKDREAMRKAEELGINTVGDDSEE